MCQLSSEFTARIRVYSSSYFGGTIGLWMLRKIRNIFLLNRISHSFALLCDILHPGQHI